MKKPFINHLDLENILLIINIIVLNTLEILINHGIFLKVLLKNNLKMKSENPQHGTDHLGNLEQVILTKK